MVCERVRARTARLVLAIGVALASAPAMAQTSSTVDFTISGTSTIRGWTCTAKGTIAVTPGTSAPAVPGFATGVASATVTVPLKAFTCPNAEMTEHLNQAMKSDQFTEVVYRIETYEMAGDVAQASGSMTIVGNTKPMSVPLTLKAAPGGLTVEGNTRLDLTTFGVEPPTVMLGMLKVGPQIRISFNGTVAAAAK